MIENRDSGKHEGQGGQLRSRQLSVQEVFAQRRLINAVVNGDVKGEVPVAAVAPKEDLSGADLEELIRFKKQFHDAAPMKDSGKPVFQQPKRALND